MAFLVELPNDIFLLIPTVSASAGVPSPEKTGRKRPSTGRRDDQDLESELTGVPPSGLSEAEIMKLSRGDYGRYFKERGT